MIYDSDHVYSVAVPVIGLTLAVTEGGSGGEFNTLFVVIIFHQMFEGLGLGTRLAQLPLPQSLNYVPLTAGAIYAICTPLGMAIGLGVRTSFNPESTNALITQGTLDAISSGILLYTGLVGRSSTLAGSVHVYVADAYCS